MNRNIIYLMLIAFLMPFAFGAECTGLNFESITVDVYDNSTFVLKIESTAGTPIVPWSDYVSATLEYDNTNFTNLGSDFVDVSSSLTNVHTWMINASTSGTFLFNVSVLNNTGGICSNNLSIDVTPSVIKPDVSASIVSLNSTMTFGIDEVFSLVLDNVGFGDAFNVTGTLVSSGLLNSTTLSVDSVSNQSFENVDYTLTPQTCGAGSLDVSIPTYYDSSGALMDPIGSLNENFNVIGSDVDVLESTFSVTKIGTSPVTSVIMNVTVTNTGDIDATNTTVKFYRGTYSTLIGEVVVGNLSVGEERNISYTWSSPAAGTHIIKTLVESTNECPNLDMEDMATSIVIPSTGGGSGGSGGGGGGGGGGSASSSSNDVTYGTHKFAISDVINFESDGEVYVFEIVDVFDNGIQIKNPENKILGLFENGNYKYNLIEDEFVRITLDEVRSDGYITLTFTKIEDVLTEEVADNTTKETIENKTPIDLEEETYNITSGNYSGLDLFNSNESADTEGFSLAGKIFNNNGNIWVSIFIFILLVVVILGYIFMKNKEEEEEEDLEEEE